MAKVELPRYKAFLRPTEGTKLQKNQRFHQLDKPTNKLDIHGFGKRCVTLITWSLGLISHQSNIRQNM